jgi:hypothetical protein
LCDGLGPKGPTIGNYGAMTQQNNPVEFFTEQIRNDAQPRERVSLRKRPLPCKSLASGATDKGAPGVDLDVTSETLYQLS